MTKTSEKAESSSPFSYLPERLEELNEFNEAHCAVRYHEVLEAFETAFTSTVPWPAAPCATAHREKSKYLSVTDKGAFKMSDFGTSGLLILYSCSHTQAVPWLFLRGPERTVGGTGWTRPCWKKRRRRRKRPAIPGLYWMRGRRVQESRLLQRQRELKVNTYTHTHTHYIITGNDPLRFAVVQ